jgi:Kef-type K+ transport system membrane component KefB
LGWVSPDEIISGLADFGLAMLFFLAGSEIDIDRIRGRVLNRSILGWLVALVAGLAVAIGLGALLGYGVIAGVFIGIALTSTALGTIMPVLRDAGELRTPFGTAVIGIGAAGEFGPLIAISVFLSGRNPAWRPRCCSPSPCSRPPRSSSAPGATTTPPCNDHHDPADQRTVRRRFVILIVAAMVALSLVLGLDMLLGAFAAGMIVRFILADATPADREAVETKRKPSGSASWCLCSSSSPGSGSTCRPSSAIRRRFCSSVGSPCSCCSCAC